MGKTRKFMMFGLAEETKGSHLAREPGFSGSFNFAKWQ